jgi:hypothetical protein
MTTPDGVEMLWELVTPLTCPPGNAWRDPEVSETGALM